jgi:hypothetical protein
MAKLILSTSEFTVETLVSKMRKTFGNKKNGAIFSNADIHDWANKQRIPKQYGGQYMKVSKLGPLKILTLSQQPFADYTPIKLQVTNE